MWQNPWMARQSQANGGSTVGPEQGPPIEPHNVAQLGTRALAQGPKNGYCCCP